MDWRLAHAWLHGYSSALAGEEADGSRWDSVPGGVAAFERGREHAESRSDDPRFVAAPDEVVVGALEEAGLWQPGPSFIGNTSLGGGPTTMRP